MIMPYFVLEEAVVVDHIAARFTITCTINAYRYKSCEFESCSWPGALDTILCDKVYQWLATNRWISPGTRVSSTNKTDGHDITEILLKVALNTIILTLTIKCVLYPEDRHVWRFSTLSRYPNTSFLSLFNTSCLETNNINFVFGLTRDDFKPINLRITGQRTS